MKDLIQEITVIASTSPASTSSPTKMEVNIDVPFFLFLTVAIVLFAGLIIIFRPQKNAS